MEIRLHKYSRVRNNYFSEHHRVLITGGSGQVGRALAEVYAQNGTPLSRHELDLSQPKSLLQALHFYQPAAVINAAAYTQVDQAENEEVRARTVNAIAPGIMAEWCAQQNIPFVHFSTDYVFDGTKQSAWTEEDRPSPLNVYGKSKLAGEARIIQTGGRFLIFRTSWVYNAMGNNFLRTMLHLGREQKTLSVVNDQHGSPTYAKHLAQITREVLQVALDSPVFPSGIYHLCNKGTASWYEFAQAIFAAARKQRMELRVQEVLGIPASAYPTAALRPENSRLCTQKFETTFGLIMPHWHDGLLECIQSLAETPIENL